MHSNLRYHLSAAISNLDLDAVCNFSRHYQFSDALSF